MKSPSSNSGFTLIELLASMAVLLVMVVMLGRIFADSTSAWEAGTSHSENNSVGRAAMEIIAHDLGSAMADDVLTLSHNSADQADVLGLASDSISFVSFNNNESDQHRSAQQIIYRVVEMNDTGDPPTPYPHRYRLVRESIIRWSAESYGCYTNQTWYNSVSRPVRSDIAEHVRTFEIWMYDQAGASHANYDSEVHGPPLYADLYLELLGEDDAIRAETIHLGGGDAAEFADKRVRRYATRVFFHNLAGYLNLQ